MEVVALKYIVKACMVIILVTNYVEETIKPIIIEYLKSTNYEN
jgi:hypothetical protein